MDYLRLAVPYLERSGVPTPRLDAEVLLGHILNKDRVYLYVHFDQPLEPAEVDRYRDLLVRRARREPVAYLIGEKEFYSRPFRVSPAVLIPRPSTETLIDTVLAWAKDRRGDLTIVDVGTGSGAIAVTLAAELPHARVIATDASAEALAVARHNSERHGVAERIRFTLGSWLDPLQDVQADALVSNPPYIESGTIATLEPEVSRYEPVLALDGGPDGLAAYRQLIPRASRVVVPGGALFFEVGSGQAASVAQVAQNSGWFVERIVKDPEGIERVVSLRRGGR